MTRSTAGSTRKPAGPGRLWWLCLVLGGLTWGCSALRHGLLQSNAYDLGLFDQWIWLISHGLPPISSMEKVHVLADHGAWLLYAAGPAYRLLPSVQWLLASQALALSFTAIPIWSLARQAGLSRQRCWLACGLWWLQPVVFNSALFDFHPETWVMPAFALALWAERAERPRLWFGLLVLMLGARDGLVLVSGGMALDLAVRRRWRWSAAAAGLSIGWLLLLSRWLFPMLRDGEGPKAAARLFDHLGGGPLMVINTLDWGGGLSYLLLLALPCAWLWRRRSLPTLLIGLPLVIVNLLSSTPSTRTLIHHYSLPLAIVAVAAAIDGGLRATNAGRNLIWSLAWATACWLALAKPWFFSGPYLQRLPQLGEVRDAIARVPSSSDILTTSYLVPQLSQRRTIAFPKKRTYRNLTGKQWNALLLNPDDPGWGSSSDVQQRLINQARDRRWDCQRWDSGLTLCHAPDASELRRPDGKTPADTHLIQ